VRKEFRQPSSPPTVLFEDLKALREWHLQFAEIYQSKSIRMEVTSRYASDSKYRTLHAMYRQKADMHRSAAKVLGVAIQSQERPLDLSDEGMVEIRAGGH
jgi:hypothetical protein